jgi:hypothetical protein
VDAHTFTKQVKKSLNKRLPARNLMATVFLEKKRVFMVEFIQQTTITSEVYCKTLIKIRRAIQNKRISMMTPAVLVVFLHVNARPHTSTAVRTLAVLYHFNWELFDHTPYSPDLAQATTTCLST